MPCNYIDYELDILITPLFFPDLFGSRAVFRANLICKQDEVREGRSELRCCDHRGTPDTSVSISASPQPR